MLIPRYLAIIHYRRCIHCFILAALYYAFEMDIERWKGKKTEINRSAVEKKQTHCPIFRPSFYRATLGKHFRGVHTFISLFFFLSRTSTAHVTRSQILKIRKGIERIAGQLTSVKNIDIAERPPSLVHFVRISQQLFEGCSAAYKPVHRRYRSPLCEDCEAERSANERGA